MGVALDWVAKIIAAAAVMVLPGLAGDWLDHRLNVRFCTLLGFGLGLVSGITYLLTVTKRPPGSQKGPPPGSPPPDNG